MIRALLQTTGIGFASILPFNLDNADHISRSSKTAKDFLKYSNDTETGWDRLYRMFSVTEYGSVSSELNSIYQASFLGFLTGATYGGFVNSRIAYMDFMENNQATAFKSHFDAKKKLQDSVTINFAKGAFRWGWRLALFTSSYVGIVTLISVYRGKSSMLEYVTAGGLTGSMYKVNMGLRGMVVGGVLGSALGSIGGVASLLALRVSGTSMEEIRYWQYKWRTERDGIIREVDVMPVSDDEEDLAPEHDKKVGKVTVTLDNLDAQNVSQIK